MVSAQSDFKASRAIGSEFLRRRLLPLAVMLGMVLVVANGFGIWAVSRNAWWWVFESLVLLFSLLCLAGAVMVARVVRRIDTAHSPEQRRSVKAFVDKLQLVAEHVQTPQPVIIFRVVLDVVRARKPGFISEMASASKSLAPDYAKLRTMF